MEVNVGYLGTNIGRTIARTPGDCCLYCQSMTSCRSWTWDRPTQFCFLKATGRVGASVNTRYVSGSRATEWSQWSACTLRCGGGVRSRVCQNILGAAGFYCRGAATQPCNTNLCGRPQVAGLWVDYVDDYRAGRAPMLPDFSYAGYRYQAVPIPVKRQFVYDVTKYGCRPNVRYCDVGLMAAIAAVSKTGGILYFPPGTYYLGNPATHWLHPTPTTDATTMFPITKGNVVIRGAGVGRTRLHFVAMIGVLAFTNIQFSGPGDAGGPPTYLAKNLRKGDRKIFVTSVVGFAPGRCLRISQNDPWTVGMWFENTYVNPTWTTVRQEGPLVRLLHCIASINPIEKTITLIEPIQVNVYMTRNNSVLVAPFNYIEDVGVESMTISSDWATIPGAFSHHTSAMHDYGWQPIGMRNVRNGWVRDVVFESVSGAVMMESVITCTVQNIRVVGKQGHFGVSLKRGYGTLIKDIYSAQWHGSSTASSDANMVVLRAGMPVGARADAHGRAPIATLWDGITGGILTGNGGNQKDYPNHSKYLTVWNFLHRGLSKKDITKNYRFWSNSVPTKNEFFQAIVGGLTGDQITLDQSQTLKTEGFGSRVLPASLFEAQVYLRKTGRAAKSPIIASGNIPEQPPEAGGVAGGWAEWSDWSTCKGPCGDWLGITTRTRLCTNPMPSLGGKYCVGEGYEEHKCTVGPCSLAINGKWSEWGDWSTCNGNCGSGQWGKRSRRRSCSDPKPQFGGKDCNGDGLGSESCSTFECASCQCTAWMPDTGECDCRRNLIGYSRTCERQPSNRLLALASGKYASLRDDNTVGLAKRGDDVLFATPIIRIGERCLGLVYPWDEPLPLIPCDSLGDTTQHWFRPNQSKVVVSMSDPSTCLAACKGGSLLCAAPCDVTNSAQWFALEDTNRKPGKNECEAYPLTKTETCTC
eukprot:comp23560_c1_seq1/m.39800 comp23560_c1_seq1/g.39800  ORF comp23560_c1_seq1/g.39800 comp23560_c1_seq1/m.39800 type:complete len:922 (-) comp23560_c1_seq1:551-3316(-)